MTKLCFHALRPERHKQPLRERPRGNIKCSRSHRPPCQLYRLMCSERRFLSLLSALLAAAKISSIVSPRTLRAIRKAPICAGVAFPVIISSKGYFCLLTAKWQAIKRFLPGAVLFHHLCHHRLTLQFLVSVIKFERSTWLTQVSILSG